MAQTATIQIRHLAKESDGMQLLKSPRSFIHGANDNHAIHSLKVPEASFMARMATMKSTIGKSPSTKFALHSPQQRQTTGQHILTCRTIETINVPVQAVEGIRVHHLSERHSVNVPIYADRPMLEMLQKRKIARKTAL